MINVRSQEIDPSEIEAVLTELPAVAEARCISINDASGGEELKAIVVTISPCTRNEINEHCKRRLPKSKRPKIIEFCEALPHPASDGLMQRELIDNYSRTGTEYNFDPCFGFRRTGKKFSSSTITGMANLSPPLRSLLVTDGTVTRFLEAFFWEPIKIELLLHAQAEGEIDYQATGLKVTDSLLRRRAILRGVFTGLAYVFADTIVAANRLSTNLNDLLAEGRIGIGEIIRDSRLETYREILFVERTNAGEWGNYLDLAPCAPVVLRCYNIRHRAKVLMHISEILPESRFDLKPGAFSK